MSHELSDASLAKCERVIEKGMQTFVHVGRALQRIRDGRLFEPRYPSFEKYCQMRWQMSKPHATRLIGAAQVVDEIAESANGNGAGPKDDGTHGRSADPGPLTERVARELTPLKENPDAVRSAWVEARNKAAAEGRDVTSFDVRAAVRGRQLGPVVPVPTKPQEGSEDLVANVLTKWQLVAAAAAEVVSMERDIRLRFDLTDDQTARLDQVRRRVREAADQ